MSQKHESHDKKEHEHKAIQSLCGTDEQVFEVSDEDAKIVLADSDYFRSPGFERVLAAS